MTLTVSGSLLALRHWDRDTEALWRGAVRGAELDDCRGPDSGEATDRSSVFYLFY